MQFRTIHLFSQAKVKALLQAPLWYTACKEFSRNPCAWGLKDCLHHSSVSAMTGMLGALLHVSSGCSSRDTKQLSHRGLTSLWLPWKGQVCVAPTCPAMAPNATTMENLRDQRAKNRQEKCKIARNVTLHCCHSGPLQPKNLDICFLICKHLRQFISGVTSVFSCGR